MNEDFFFNIITPWQDTCNQILQDSDSLFIALFDSQGKLLFANKAIRTLFQGQLLPTIINPNLSKLQERADGEGLLFEGNVTLGNMESLNTTIKARIYGKDNTLLLSGGVDAAQLVEQNQTMHVLNAEISSLQRTLIKEKRTLQQTMDKLDRANFELKELNATKDKFFSILAHDLRNAFITILGYSELLHGKLQKSDKDDSLTLFAEHIHTTSKATYSLLEVLLEWSKSQQGKVTFKKENIALNLIVNDCLTLYENYAKEKEVMFHDEIPGETLVYADKHMLYTILRNLVGNAIKYSRKQGDIWISAKVSEDIITVQVKDNGVGMDEKTKNSLFKIEETKSRRGTGGENGTGLGLLLCRDFVIKHGGQIFVESQPGKGSVFGFSLPGNS